MTNFFEYVRKPFFYGKLPLRDENEIDGRILEISSEKEYQNILSLSSCDNRIIIIFADGEVYSLGENDHGELGTGDYISTVEFKRVKSPDECKIIKSSCAKLFSLFIDKKGSLYVCGTGDRIKFPKKVDTSALDISSFGSTVCAMNKVNSLIFWSSFEVFDQRYTFDFPSNIKEMSTGIGFSTVLLENGSLYRVSADRGLELIVVPYNPLDGGNRFKSASSSEHYTSAIDSEGGVWFFGEMGNFDSKKAKITVADNFEKVFAFPRHTVLFDRHDKCYTIGANECGQLGNKTQVDTLTPTMIDLDDTFYEVSGGNTFTIFLPFGFTSERIKYLKEDIIPGSLAKSLQDSDNFLGL